MRTYGHQEAEENSAMRMWTHAEAVNAVPYLRAIVRSLREHWLQARQARLRGRK